MPAPVFVYGTLMQDRSNHGLLRGCRFLGRAAACGVDLYAVTPRLFGAVREPGSAVRGEVYAVDPLTLEALDRVKGNGRLYKRELFPVELQETRETVVAWVYLWLHTVKPPRAIPLKDQA